MRNELIELYQLACANANDKDIVRAYQRARDRIGPQIAVHEAIDADALHARVARLEGIVRMLIGCVEDAKKYPDIHDDFVDELESARRALEEK